MNTHTARRYLLAGLLAGGMLLAAGSAGYAIEYEPTAEVRLNQLKALVKRSFETPPAPGAASVVAQIGRKRNSIVFDAGDGLTANNIVFDAGDGIYKGPDWASGLQPSQLSGAVADQIENGPVPELRMEDKTRTLQLVRAQGSLRYSNHARRGGSAPAATRQQALDLAVKALAAIGLPQSEIGYIPVDSLMAGALEQVVTADRRVNGLPVLGSRARVVVAGQGSIQRLDVDWPRFRIKQGLRLLLPEALLGQVAGAIQQRAAAGDVHLNTSLVYAPAGYTLPSRAAGITALDDWESPIAAAAPDYVPAVLVTVQSAQASFQVLVPVVAGK